MAEQKMKILIATAFPTKGAGSGALVTTQAKSYVEDGHEVCIITGNNNTFFEKLEGVKYHVVPFTAQEELLDKDKGEYVEKIDGQLPFNYLMFTTHTKSTANFWNASLDQIEQYREAYRKALAEEVKSMNPDVIHAQHNWLLSATATEMGKPVVTTIHGTDLMGYDKSKELLEGIEEDLKEVESEAKKGTSVFTSEELAIIKNIFDCTEKYADILKQLNNRFNLKDPKSKASDKKSILKLFEERKKYKFYISESEKSAQNSDKIIVISEAQKEKFMSLFPDVDEKKVELVKNGYDPRVFHVDKSVNKDELFSQLHSDLTPDGKIDSNYDNMMLFVGKFADFKGIDSILSAAKLYETEFERQGKKALTIIVGSGALDEKLRNQRNALELKNTHFVGFQGPDVVNPLQNLATVSLIPSREEPFGLVVIEGTACGHPVIATNSGGIPDILNTEKEDLPNQDIVQTRLGLLIAPLPERPKALSDEEKDKLDSLTSKYVVNKEQRGEIATSICKSFPNVSEEELITYLESYSRSSEALANSVVDIVNNVYTFNNEDIAEYTEETYAMPVIRKQLIELFKIAKEHYELTHKNVRNLEEQ